MTDSRNSYNPKPGFSALPGTVIEVRRPSVVTSFVGAGTGSFIGLLETDPTRVLKFPFPTEDAQADIEQEKQIYAILGPHPLIATVHEVSERGIFLEYYRLGSLRAYYKTLNGQLPPIDLRTGWCLQAIEVLIYIHSKGVIHNDLSPRNILLSPAFDLKLCDFGFAGMEGEKQYGRAEWRYQRYKPLTDHIVSVYHDLFAIGSLFYELFTGKPPYLDEESGDVNDLYRDHRFPSLDGIPSPYCSIIEKCWNDEYASSVDIQKDLP
jgi:serine/threonine protein kinase